MSSHRRPAGLMVLGSGLYLAAPVVDDQLGLAGADAVALAQLVGGLLSIVAGVWLLVWLVARQRRDPSTNGT